MNFGPSECQWGWPETHRARVIETTRIRMLQGIRLVLAASKAAYAAQSDGRHRCGSNRRFAPLPLSSFSQAGWSVCAREL